MWSWAGQNGLFDGFDFNLGRDLNFNHSAGVHDVLGVQGLLDGLHHGQGGGVFVVCEFVGLETANAVFGADRAVKCLDLVKHPSVHFVFVIA